MQQHGDAGEADADAGELGVGIALARAELEHDDPQRHRRDDQRREPGRDGALGEEEHRVRARQQEADQRRTTRSARRADAQRPAGRASTTAAMIAPAAMNRVETASSGGIVSTAIAMKRYVEPQTM